MDNPWMKNKIHYRETNGFYQYKCKEGNCCNPRILHKKDDINYNVSIYSDYCKYHYKKNEMHRTIIIC